MDLILHHYDPSPFSEKVRKVFGMTGQAWAARLADQGQLAGVGALWVGRRP